MANDKDRNGGVPGRTAHEPGNCLDLLQARLDRTSGMIHRDIRALLDYWQRLRGDRPVPYRAEVDPRDMRCDARHLFILEDLGGGSFRFRLGGTALNEALGTELRGLSAREIMVGRARESFAAMIEETLAEPGVGYARLLAGANPADVWELLLLPLRSDFGATDRVLGALLPADGLPRRATEPVLRFAIDSMTIHPVKCDPDTGHTSTGPALSGFGEDPAGFNGAPGHGFTAIPGGRANASPEGGRDDGSPPRRPKLRIVRDD